jgi:hypothetical protein
VPPTECGWRISSVQGVLRKVASSLADVEIGVRVAVGSTVNLQISTDAERGQSPDIGCVIDPQVLLTCDSTREQATA